MHALLLATLSLITQSAFAERCEPQLSTPSASVHSCRGMHLVRLTGRPIERAHALGRLLKPGGPLSPDVINYFTGKVSGLAEKELGFLATPANLLHHQLVRLFHRAAPTGLAEELDAVAEELGIDPIVLRRGMSLPDLGVFLQGLGSHPLFAFLPAAGCTSVAAPVGAGQTASGGFTYGRNLDFAGVGIFDRHPMILLHEPSPGSSELRHLVIGADGLPFAGITGVNEAGITFAVHQNYGRDISLYGVPMIMIGELVLRSARSLAEAEEILRKHKPANLWTFVLNDLKSGESMAVESSQRHFLVRQSRGREFAQTNHSMHSETRAWQNADLGLEANSVLRLKLAQVLAKENGSAANIARILAYQNDRGGFFSPPRDILKAETIQSVIFEAMPGQSATLYLSLDPAPTSSGRYLSFSLNDLFHNPDSPSPVLVDFLQTAPEARRRQLASAKAFSLYFDQDRAIEAAELLEDQHTIASALFRSVANYHAGQFAESERLAAEALRDPRFASELTYLRQSLEQVRLAAFHRLGRLEEARALAQKLLNLEPSGPAKGSVRKLAELTLKGRRPPAWMLRLHFDFFSGDISGRNDQHK